MKKKLLIALVVAVIICIGMITLKTFDMNVFNYTFTLRINWDISLPNTYEEIHRDDEEPSFLGDGYRYHIFQYNDTKRLENRLEWINKSDTSQFIENEVVDILKNMDIEESYYPDFSNYKYYTTIENKDDSRLYIVWNMNTDRVHIIEYFK